MILTNDNIILSILLIIIIIEIMMAGQEAGSYKGEW